MLMNKTLLKAFSLVGRYRGRLGGEARKRALSAERRSEIAAMGGHAKAKAAKARAKGKR